MFLLAQDSVEMLLSHQCRWSDCTSCYAQVAQINKHKTRQTALRFPYTQGECFPAGSAVKHLPAKQEMQVRSLGQEDPLERKRATRSSILVWEIHGQRSLADYGPWGCKESDTT